MNQLETIKLSGCYGCGSKEFIPLNKGVLGAQCSICGYKYWYEPSGEEEFKLIREYLWNPGGYEVDVSKWNLEKSNKF